MLCFHRQNGSSNVCSLCYYSFPQSVTTGLGDPYQDNLRVQTIDVLNQGTLHCSELGLPYREVCVLHTAPWSFAASSARVWCGRNVPHLHSVPISWQMIDLLLYRSLPYYRDCSNTISASYLPCARGGGTHWGAFYVDIALFQHYRFMSLKPCWNESCGTRRCNVVLSQLSQSAFACGSTTKVTTCKIFLWPK